MPEKVSNTTQSIENNNALRQALVVIEHKIRNLEKRKTKLESYRTIQNSGKELSNDQKLAVSKYDEVAQSLEFARDLSKQMLQIANVSEKEEKKKARKDAVMRAQAETAKIREVLTIQNILVAFREESTRNDFINGSNGAAKLEENDVCILEKFCIDIQIKRQESPDDQPFLSAAQKAAEHFSLTIDGRPKQYGETTYENLKRIFQKIQESGYLDRAGKNETMSQEDLNDEQIEENPVDEGDQKEVELATERMSEIDLSQNNEVQQPSTATIEDAQQVKVQSSQIIPVQVEQQQSNIPKFTSEAPSAAAVPAPAFPPAPQAAPVAAVIAGSAIPAPLQQPQIALQQLQRQGAHQLSIQPAPQAVQPISVPPAATQIQGIAASGHFPPTTVRAVEQAYFKQHQYIQQMRPLAEVIGGGNFFFLQDSELDAPDMIGIPAPPIGFAANQPPQHPQPPNLTEGQQSNAVNITHSSPTQGQQLQNALNNVQPQAGIAQSVVQSNSQQIGKPTANTLTAPAANISAQVASNNLTDPSTVTIPTQTFTNQSFPPIVPTPQVQSIFPQTAATTVNHSPPGIHHQVTVVTNTEKTQQSSVLPNTQIQQTQPNVSQTPQITQVFSQAASTMSSITPHQLIAHHQQQQSLSAQTQPSVAGTTNNLSIAEHQAAALASLQHQQHQQLAQATTNANNLPSLPTGFANAKFPSNIVPTPQAVSAQSQQQTQIAHHNLNNQVNNINSIGTGGGASLSQPSTQEQFDQNVRILDHKPQKIDIKERTSQVQVKDIIATASVNDWETDATKLQIRQQQTDQQVHKPTSHYSSSHNASHFHATQHHNTNNSNNVASERGASNINDSNQWSNDIHTNSQHSGQNTSNNGGSGLNNKSNDWSNTFDSQDTNHWNNGEGSGNYRNRQSFGRSDRTNGGGPGNGVRNNGDRNDNPRPGNGGYRGRSNYSSQNGNSNSSGSGSAMSGGNRNSNVYFRNNDNYYQNGNGGGYNGGTKDGTNSRYGGNGNSGESYRGRPSPANGAGGGPRASGNGPPPRQQRNSLGNGNGMGPRGQTSGGPRSSTGGYSRPPRQQDVNVVN